MKISKKKEESATPKEPKVKTQLMPDDVAPKGKGSGKEGLTLEEIEESVIEINPDVNSMDSRG